MSLRRILFHPLAADEAADAFQWYSERNRDVALAFRDELEIAISAIASAPHRWPRFHAHFQRYLLRRFPFSVVYASSLELVEIVAIAHHRRRPGYWRVR